MKKQISNPILKPNSFSRRQFIGRTTLATGAVAFSFPYVGRVLGANDRINVACIGVGGKGDQDSCCYEEDAAMVRRSPLW